jgi:hypothetical protein
MRLRFNERSLVIRFTIRYYKKDSESEGQTRGNRKVGKKLEGKERKIGRKKKDGKIKEKLLRIARKKEKEKEKKEIFKKRAIIEKKSTKPGKKQDNDEKGENCWKNSKKL